MGQTSSNSAASEAATASKSHYELLDLPPSATDEEIKKAYRRKALELHPDRNYGREDAATALFAEIQTAYSVLSDPQERAWYDAHQAEFLSGGEPGEAHYEKSVKVTTAEDIRAMCASRNRAYSDFSDGSNGFFTNVRELFERLAMEERIASANADWDPVDYPSFGSSKDEFQDVVKKFYSVWGGFSTAKSFAWKDLYRPSADYDRRTRRAMEKENQKIRDDAAREFNDAVRALVLFVRRRDPRYVATEVNDAERQKALREAAAAQAARQRKANAEKLAGQVIPDWAQSRGDEELDDYATEEDEDEEEEAEEEPEIWECVVCSKTFKSEGQYDAHERSKKHKQAVYQLKREMRDQDIELGLKPSSKQESAMDQNIEELSEDVEEKLDVAASSPTGTEDEDKKSEDGLDDENATDDRELKTTMTDNTKTSEPSESDDQDDSYAPRTNVESRILDDVKSTGVSRPLSSQDEVDTGGLSTPSKKIGKAKEKRAKRAAAKEAATAKSGGQNNGTEELECFACKEVFGSKNKLFDHIKGTGHARPVADAGNGNSKLKKKGKAR